MKRRISAILLGLMLLLCCPAISIAAETTMPATESVQEAKDDEPSKTMKIVQFLVIFTMAMGVTAYIVVRPKLKMLKELNEKK